MFRSIRNSAKVALATASIALVPSALALAAEAPSSKGTLPASSGVKLNASALLKPVDKNLGGGQVALPAETVKVPPMFEELAKSSSLPSAAQNELKNLLDLEQQAKLDSAGGDLGGSQDERGLDPAERLEKLTGRTVDSGQDSPSVTHGNLKDRIASFDETRSGDGTGPEGDGGVDASSPYYKDGSTSGSTGLVGLGPGNAKDAFADPRGLTAGDHWCGIFCSWSVYTDADGDDHFRVTLPLGGVLSNPLTIDVEYQPRSQSWADVLGGESPPPPSEGPKKEPTEQPVPDDYAGLADNCNWNPWYGCLNDTTSTEQKVSQPGPQGDQLNVDEDQFRPSIEERKGVVTNPNPADDSPGTGGNSGYTGGGKPGSGGMCTVC
jgi:hypothetical protein